MYFFEYKQASDDEDNEIEIVEPKTDLITLDSDDDEPTTNSPIKNQQPAVVQLKTQQQTQSYSSPQHSVDVKIKPASIAQATNRQVVIKPTAPPTTTAPQADDNMDLMSMAQSFLASMLEVDIQEGPVNSPGSSDSSGQKKQPRKKLTNKPNPTLLKQKALMELERLEEMKRNDQKLKMKCSVELKKAEEVFPFAKEMLEAKVKEQQEYEEAKKHKLEQQDVEELVDEADKVATKEKEDDLNSSSTGEKKENNDTIKNTSSITIDEKESAAETSVEIIDINNEEQDAEKDSSMESAEKETSIEIIDEIEEDKSSKNIAEKEISGETIEKEKSIVIVDKTENLLQNDKKDDSQIVEVKVNDKADDDVKEKEEISETITEETKDNEIEMDSTNGITDKQNLPEVMEIEEKSPATPTKDEPMEVDEKIEESPEKVETNLNKTNENVDEHKEIIEKVPPTTQEESNGNNSETEMEKLPPTTQEESNDKNEEKAIEKVLPQIEDEIRKETEIIKPTKEILLSGDEPQSTTTAIFSETVSDKDKEAVKVVANNEETNKTLSTSSSITEDLPNKDQQTIATKTAIENETTATSSNGNA